ncbi:MAG: hypothetical protein ACRC24_05400 [Vibrionaceae bacterium]
MASRGALLGVAAARRGAARVLPKALLVFGLLPLVEGQELAVQEEGRLLLPWRGVVLRCARLSQPWLVLLSFVESCSSQLLWWCWQADCLLVDLVAFYSPAILSE